MPTTPGKGGQATAANFYISRFFHLAVACGLDTDRLLADAGIPPAHIDRPDLRIEVEKLADLIIGICDELQDESMSLSRHPVPRGSFYMMGKLTVHEPNLGKALLQMQRFLGLVTKSFVVNLEIRGGKAILTCDPAHPEMDPDHLFAEMNVMMLHRYSSWLIAENIPLIDVFFSYPPPPRQVKEYAYLFPGKHRFNASCMGFSFSSHFLACGVVQNTGTLKSFMRRCPVELFSHPKTDFSLTSEVHSLLYKHASGGSLTMDEAAESLLLTRRTLIRRLKDEGTSFLAIKNQVRRDRAIYYLSGHALSVTEIALKTGYSDPAVFTRAFRSWTGMSPREYRARYAK